MELTVLPVCRLVIGAVTEAELWTLRYTDMIQRFLIL